VTTYTPKADGDLSLKELVTLVDKSFWIFRRNARDPQLVDFPALALYRHLIQMAKGIELLLTAKAGRQAIPLLRSAFEAYLSLKYMFQERYEERSLAWLCSYYRRLLQRLDLLDPTTEDGLKLREEIRNLFPKAPLNYVSREVYAANRTRIREILNSPPLDIVNKQYDKLKTKGEEPTWHSLDDLENPEYGYKGIKRLSKRINLESLYLIYYARWSDVIHAKEFESLLSPLPNGTLDFDPLEGSASVDDPTIELGVRTFLRQSTPLMAGKFGSGT